MIQALVINLMQVINFHNCSDQNLNKVLLLAEAVSQLPARHLYVPTLETTVIATGWGFTEAYSVSESAGPLSVGVLSRRDNLSTRI